MIKENLLVVIRNFWKAKTITLINISGLSIGISAALIIFLIVQYHHNFNKHQPNGLSDSGMLLLTWAVLFQCRKNGIGKSSG